MAKKKKDKSDDPKRTKASSSKKPSQEVGAAANRNTSLPASEFPVIPKPRRAAGVRKKAASEISADEIALRAYYIAEHRRNLKSTGRRTRRLGRSGAPTAQRGRQEIILKGCRPIEDSPAVGSIDIRSLWRSAQQARETFLLLGGSASLPSLTPARWRKSYAFAVSIAGISIMFPWHTEAFSTTELRKSLSCFGLS